MKDIYKRLLLISDAAEGQPQEVDPLDMPGSSKETDYPVLKGGKIYRVSVRSIDLVDAKKEGAPAGAKNVLIKVATTQDELSTGDETLHAGFTVSKYIPIYASGERTMANVRKDLLTFIHAVEGKDSKAEPSTVYKTPDRYLNKPVDVKITTKDDPTYGLQNSLRFVIPGM